MCRLVGIIASEPTEFGLVLTDAPRCLAALSREHPDGWGIAVHHDADWLLHKGTERADADSRFHEIAAKSRGTVLVSHIRQKTVGPTRLENTHPFVRGGWVFAHNGTIGEIDRVRAGASKERLAEIAGDTDSEVLFAHLLSAIDAGGLDGLEAAARALREAGVGAINFLLSDGTTTFAHRFGRSLYVLERGPSDPLREERSVARGAAITTRWTTRRSAVFIASERMTDEPWQEIPDGTLLRIDRGPSTPSVRPVPAHVAA